MHRIITVVVVTCAALSIAAARPAIAESTIIFVNAAADGMNDGSSWGDAFSDLQDALGAARSGDQIWVAAGIYRPGSPNAPLDTTFTLVGGVALYGGFAGGETELEQRDWIKNETILSGDLVGDGSQRVFHVLSGNNLTDGSVVDGFTIRDGHAPDVFREHGDGAGVWLFDSTLRVANSVLTSNTAVTRGGAIFASESDLTLIDSQITSNHAHLGGGGAVFAAASTLSICNCQFDDNASSTHEGGALHLFECSLDIRESSFTGNDSEGGGAIRSANTDVRLDATEFTDNSATFGGGALFWSGGLVHVTGCLFENNTGDGPALYKFGGTGDLIFEESRVQGNFGGGIGMQLGSGHLTIVGSEFTNNSAAFSVGGAVFVSATAERITIKDTIFESNSSPFDGGAISAGSQDFVIENCRIIDNLANGFGGISSGGNLTIISSEITGNINTFDFIGGGGMAHSGGSLTMINSVVSNNFPGGVTAGIFFPTSIEIINSTIAKNPLFLPSADAGLLIHPGSQAIVRNSIIWGNGIAAGSCEGNCGSFGFGCWCDETCCDFQDCCFDKAAVCGGCDPGDVSEFIEMQQIKGPVDVMHSIVHGLSPGSVFDIPGANNIGDDPLFVNAVEGDFRLSGGSPAIDAGSNVFVPEDITTDLDGNPRIVDGNQDGTAIVDMGAYEFQPPDDDPKEPCIFADLNCDGVVNQEDLVILVHSFGPCPDPNDCPADLNGDGIVNAKDLLILLNILTPGNSGNSGQPGGPQP